MSNIKICIISLGCSKNLVDSEHMTAYIKNAGMELVDSAELADIAVINTCAFIDDAKKEAIETILETAQYKKSGSLKAIIVTGCLAQRYKDEVMAELPEVDAVVGTGSYHEIVSVIERVMHGEKPSVFSSLKTSPIGGERVVSTAPYTAYIKIAEGCDNHCAFCIIPQLRGPYRSRPIDDIAAEAASLARAGVKELIVVAQDVSRYGTDLYGEPKLCELLTELVKIDGLEWIRLHYLYPEQTDRRLIDFIASQPKVLNYFDIPIQHISSRLLRAMNRRGDKNMIENLFDLIRSRIPDAVIRTSIIAGLPSESEAEFEELCDFLTRQKLPRVGVFTYSKEDGTEAAKIPYYLQIDEDGKQRRKEALEIIQSRVIDQYNQAKLGGTEKVLVEGFDRSRGMFFGRTYADSPDVDGLVYFTSDRDVAAGDFVNVKITAADGFDLEGERI